MTSGHLERGAAAEDFAARALEADGYRILLRNHRTRAGEIDIVAARRGVVTFVEVKARRAGAEAGGPDATLTAAKMRRVARAAACVLRERRLPAGRSQLLGAAVDLDAAGRPVRVRFLNVEELR